MTRLEKEIRKAARPGNFKGSYQELFDLIVKVHQDIYDEENLPTMQSELQELLDNSVMMAYAEAGCNWERVVPEYVNRVFQLWLSAGSAKSMLVIVGSRNFSERIRQFAQDVAPEAVQVRGCNNLGNEKFVIPALNLTTCADPYLAIENYVNSKFPNMFTWNA